MALPEKLRTLRDQKGETQEVASYGCGIARHSYARYEIGERYPSSKILPKIASHFGVTVEDLTNDDITTEEVLAHAEKAAKPAPMVPLDMQPQEGDALVNPLDRETDLLRLQVLDKMAGMSLDQLKKARSFIERLAKEGK